MNDRSDVGPKFFAEEEKAGYFCQKVEIWALTKEMAMRQRMRDHLIDHLGKLLKLQKELGATKRDFDNVKGASDLIVAEIRLKHLEEWFRLVVGEYQEWLEKQQPIYRSITPHKLTAANRRTMLKWMSQPPDERNLSVTEMANKLRVSRETIYAWRKRLTNEQAHQEPGPS